MNKLSFILILVLLLIGTSFGLEGQVSQNQYFESDILEQKIFYNVYLPPEYNNSQKYPVIFYLHWFGGDHRSANDFMNDINQLITKNSFPKAIIIAPDAKKTWYIDDYNGKHKYAAMFISEFLPAMNKKFNLSTVPAQRAIMGSSMGGFGALRFTMLHPNEFGICISFMAGMSTKDQIVKDNDEDYTLYHQNLYGENLKGDARANDYFISNNPLYIAQNIDPNNLKKSKWYIQTCDNDYHSLPNAELHAVFHRLGVEHEFRVNDGNHDGDCVNSSMNDALEFLKKSLEK